MYRSRRLPTPTPAVCHLGSDAARRRRRLGISQRQLSEAVGLNQSTISRFERGLIAGLQLRHYAAIVSALGLLDRATTPQRSPGAPEHDLER